MRINLKQEGLEWVSESINLFRGRQKQSFARRWSTTAIVVEKIPDASNTTIRCKRKLYLLVLFFPVGSSIYTGGLCSDTDADAVIWFDWVSSCWGELISIADAGKEARDDDVEIKSSFSIANAEKIADAERERIIIPRENN